MITEDLATAKQILAIYTKARRLRSKKRPSAFARDLRIATHHVKAAESGRDVGTDALPALLAASEITGTWVEEQLLGGA